MLGQGGGVVPVDIAAIGPRIQPYSSHTVVNCFSEKNSKFDATRYQILRLKCAILDFRRGSVPDLARGAYSVPPEPLAVFKVACF